MRIIAVLLILASSNLISQEIKRVDSERSSISYSGKHFLHNWSAENKNISGLIQIDNESISCLLYTSPSPRDREKSRMPSSA